MKKLIPIIVLLFAVSGFAQDEPKAVLVDEFGKLDCEDFNSRTYNFFNELTKNPTDIGYAIIYSAEGAKRPNWYEHQLMERVFSFGISKSRVKVFRSSVRRPEIGAQFWRVAPSSQNPVFEGEPIDYPDEKLLRPKLFFRESDSNPSGPCSNHISGSFAQLIKENLDVYGLIVFVEKNKREGLKDARHWIDDLTVYGGLTRDRIQVRIFRSSNDPHFELWIAPKKR